MTRKIIIIIFSTFVLYFAYDWFFSIDPNNPDCHGNKAFFKKTFKLDKIPRDISEIRCYSDHIGTDFAEEISFECDSATFKKIIMTLELSKQKEVPNFGRYIYKSLRKEIDTLVGFTDYKIKKQPPYHSFWYNVNNRHAYFLTYSL